MVEAERGHVGLDPLAGEGFGPVAEARGQLVGLLLALQDGDAVVAPEAAPEEQAKVRRGRAARSYRGVANRLTLAR